MKYSQGYEQDWILACVPAGKHALLDIGAYHPTELSNSRALIEAGWSAVLVEPSPEPCLSLLRCYGGSLDVTLVSAVVSRRPGLVELHATSDAVSTTEQGNYERWRERGGYHGSLFVRAVTIEELLSRFYDQFRDGGLQFVNIDTEGTSAELFRELLMVGARPACICVEHDERIPELCAIGTDCGYLLYKANENNAVFALKQVRHAW